MDLRIRKTILRYLPVIVIGFIVAYIYREHMMALLFPEKQFSERSIINKIILMMVFGGFFSSVFGIVFYFLNRFSNNKFFDALDAIGRGIQRTWNFILSVLGACGAFFEKYPWLAILPLLGGIVYLVWPAPNAYYSNDVGYYLSLAKNIYHGRGYVHPDLSPAFYRGPVFPLLIAIFYKLIGTNFVSALVMERFFWVLTVLITYIMGKELFNHRVAFGASILVLTTPVITTIYQYIWTDGVVTFLILLIQLWLWYIFTKSLGTKSFILLGFLFTIAYFVKQTAIVIVPLPFLMWLIFPEFRSRKNLINIGISYAIFALSILSWMFYIYLIGGSAGQIMMDFKVGSNVLSYISKSLSSGIVVKQDSASVMGRDSSILDIAITFFFRDLVGRIWYSYIFVASLLFTIFLAVFKRNRADIFILLGLLLYSAVVPVNVVAHFGPRGYVYIYVMMLICTIAFFDRLFSKKSTVLSTLVILAVMAVAILLQEPYKNPSVAKNPQTLDYFSEYMNVADWINKEVDPAEKIITSERDGAILHILTDDNRLFYSVHPCLGEVTLYLAERCSPPYISMWLYHGVSDPDAPRDVFMSISEATFISTIQNNDIKYVVVTPTIYSLYAYLIDHPGFEKATVIDDTYAVFRVKPSVRLMSEYPGAQWTTCTGESTDEYFRNLQSEYPDEYADLIDEKIRPWMGLTQDGFEDLVFSKDCQFLSDFPGTYEQQDGDGLPSE